MKQPDFDGRAAAETLYKFDDKSKVSNPADNYNIYGPPSLIKGANLDDPEEIAKAAYEHGYTDSLRMNRAGHLVEDDPVLDLYRERVEQIRKDLVKKGRVEPVTEEEQGWLK